MIEQFPTFCFPAVNPIINYFRQEINIFRHVNTNILITDRFYAYNGCGFSSEKSQVINRKNGNSKRNTVKEGAFLRCYGPGILPKSDFYQYINSELAHAYLTYRVSCGHYFTTPEYDVNRVNFNSYQLICVKSGKLILESPDTNAEILPGHAVIIDCYAQHHYYTPEPTEFTWLHYDGNNCRNIYNKLKEDRCLIQDGQNAMNLSIFMESLLTLARAEAPSSEIDLSENINRHILSLIKGFTKERQMHQTNDLAMRAIDYIENNYTLPIKVSDIAKSLYISESNLLRVFNAQTGSSPHDYLRKYRLEQARIRILSTNDRIRDIAFSAGFNSEEYFSWAFKQKFGVSPGQYRRNDKNNH